MRKVVGLLQRWVEERPDDQVLRADLGNALSWIGTMVLDQGRLEEAEALFADYAAAMRRNVEDAPRDTRWQEYRTQSLLMLADVQAQRGRLVEAAASVDAATTYAKALADFDPGNSPWLLNYARSRVWRARLAAAGEPVVAVAVASDAVRDLAAMHEREPRDEWVTAALLGARAVLAQLALQRGDIAAAREQLVASRALAEPAWRITRSELMRVWLARTRVLQGEIASRDGAAQTAIESWSAARDLLLGDDGDALAFPRLDPLVRSLEYLGRSDEARPYRERLARSGYVPMQPFPHAFRAAAGQGPGQGAADGLVGTGPRSSIPGGAGDSTGRR
jgi:tetratricopeptide (TPR) repeat protein